jgi:hypothetical protein
MHRLRILGLTIFLLNAARIAPAADPKIDLRIVTYNDLGKEIRALKGKVVIVDIWGEF